MHVRVVYICLQLAHTHTLCIVHNTHPIRVSVWPRAHTHTHRHTHTQTSTHTHTHNQ